MKKLFVTPLLATQRKETKKVAGETAQPITAEVINIKKEKGGNYDEHYKKFAQGR